jgi:hypothetical protein
MNAGRYSSKREKQWKSFEENLHRSREQHCIYASQLTLSQFFARGKEHVPNRINLPPMYIIRSVCTPYLTLVCHKTMAGMVRQDAGK